MGKRMLKWKMPPWMEKYREMINNTGGNSIEDLQNDRTTNVYVNAPRALLCSCVFSQVMLLETLKEKGLIK